MMMDYERGHKGDARGGVWPSSSHLWCDPYLPTRALACHRIPSKKRTSNDEYTREKQQQSFLRQTTETAHLVSLSLLLPCVVSCTYSSFLRLNTFAGIDSLLDLGLPGSQSNVRRRHTLSPLQGGRIARIVLLDGSCRSRVPAGGSRGRVPAGGCRGRVAR